MLNLGLALKRPYESKYNAYRRFLVANGKKSLGEIRNELRMKFESSYEKSSAPTPKISTFELFQLLEHNSKFGILKPDTRNIDEYIAKSIRNCPDCARGCFHSDLYQLSWLTHCPIHNKPLTYTCPSCEKSWPILSELKTRSCRACGTTYHWRELKESNAFDMDDQYIDRLSFVADSINDYRTLIKGKIDNSHMPSHLLKTHSSININHYLFPSMMVKIDPELSTKFCEYGIKLHKIYSSEYKIERQSESFLLKHYYFYYEKNLQSIAAKEVRQEMKSIIKKEIINRFTIKELKFPARFYFGDLHYLQDINHLPVLAFHIWKNLVEGNRYECGSIFKALQPHVPCLIETLVFDEAHVEYSAPMEVQTTVYKSDLWRTFTDILLYLDTMRYILNKGGSLRKLYDMIPYVFSPMCNKNQQCAFIFTNDNTLMFLYADEVTSFNLKEFSPIN